MKRSTLALGAAAIGALMLPAVVRAMELVKATATGVDYLDGLRLRVAWALVRSGLGNATPENARALMSIAHNECPPRWDGSSPIVGDATLGGGPSVGPFQVYRATALDLGLWACPPDALDVASEREAYASVANDVDKCVSMGVAVYLDKLRIAGGDVAEAVRRYNGGGAAARAYRDRALTFQADLGWRDAA